MTLDKLVEDNYHQLNENDLYIWQYILHHKRECQRISIKDLARNCNVSHTSILRFTKKLGLEGFSELKVHLKWDLAQKPNFKPRIIDDTYHEFIETMERMKNRDLTNIMEMIEKAGVICTPGSSFGPSGEGYVRFALTLPVEKITEAVQAVKNSGLIG